MSKTFSVTAFRYLHLTRYRFTTGTCINRKKGLLRSGMLAFCCPVVYVFVFILSVVTRMNCEKTAHNREDLENVWCGSPIIDVPGTLLKTSKSISLKVHPFMTTISCDATGINQQDKNGKVIVPRTWIMFLYVVLTPKSHISKSHWARMRSIYRDFQKSNMQLLTLVIYVSPILGKIYWCLAKSLSDQFRSFFLQHIVIFPSVTQGWKCGAPSEDRTLLSRNWSRESSLINITTRQSAMKRFS